MSNDWTNKLRDQLADHQEPVSHDLWAGIEQSLAQKDSSKTRLIAMKRWAAAAAAVALLGVGGSYVYLQQDRGDSKGTLQPVSMAALPSANVEKAGLHVASVKKENAQLSSVQLAARDENMLENGHEIAQMANQSLSENRNISDGNSSARISANNSISEEQSSSKQSYTKQPYTEHSSMEPSSPARKTVSGDNRVYSATVPVYTAPNQRRLECAVNLYAENFISGDGSYKSDFPMLASDPTYNDGKGNPGTFVEPGDILGNAAFYKAANPLVRSRYQNAKHHAPLAIGMQVGFGILPRLTLNTGVVYTRTSSDFQPVGVEDYTVRQVLHYVGIPLGVNFEVWRKAGFSAYVMAGGEVDFNVKNDTEESGEKTDAKRDREQFSTKLSLGLQYDVAPKVGLYLEPGAKYYFDNGSNIENTFKDKKLNFNFQFGLRWNVGK